MGYGTRGGYGFCSDIRTFSPDDTDEKFYLESNVCWSIKDILDRAQEKWGKDVDLNRIQIEAEHIHTDCIGYDRYDSSDYTDYIVVVLT